MRFVGRNFCFENFPLSIGQSLSIDFGSTFVIKNIEKAKNNFNSFVKAQKLIN